MLYYNESLPSENCAYILLRRRPLCKLDAYLLLSINGDVRLTLANAGFHYCQHYFSKRTWCLGQFLELVLRSYMRYVVKPTLTHRMDRKPEYRIQHVFSGFLLVFFLLFDHQEAFHCCLVIACVNKINMISI